jgi:hypothetical protein
MPSLDTSGDISRAVRAGGGVRVVAEEVEFRSADCDLAV